MGLFAPIIELTHTITFQPLFYHEQVLVVGAKEIVCHKIGSCYKTYMLHNNHYMDYFSTTVKFASAVGYFLSQFQSQSAIWLQQ